MELMLTKIKSKAKTFLSLPGPRRTFDVLNTFSSRLVGSSRLLSHLWFFLFPLAFNREQAAVIRGRRDYYRLKSAPYRSHSGLRRNVHRLEKALIMRPRRDTFAAEYIFETVQFYERSLRSATGEPFAHDMPELQWAESVLSHYFDEVSPGRQSIEKARQLFEAVTKDRSPSTDKVPSAKRTISTVTYSDIKSLAEQRRSIRWFEQKPVDRELIDKALYVASQAPSACNRLPYKFLIYDDPELVERVARVPFGTAGFAENIPAIAVVVGSLSSFFSPRDRHSIYVDSSLAAMSFILALETLGLSSTIINWPDFEPLEFEMQKLLGLSFSDRPVMLIAFGYHDSSARVPYSQKKDLSTFSSYNFIQGRPKTD